MWAALRQEEIRQWTKARSSDKGIKVKEEEEDAALASKGTIRAAKKEEKGPLEGQMLQMWGNGTFCHAMPSEEEG